LRTNHKGKPDENKTGKDNQIPPATIQAGSSSAESHPAEEPELAEESGPAIAKSAKFISIFRSRKNKESVPGPATLSNYMVLKWNNQDLTPWRALNVQGTCKASEKCWNV